MRINVSDFKMFEKAPYDKPDAKTIIDLALKGVTEVENIRPRIHKQINKLCFTVHL